LEEHLLAYISLPKKEEAELQRITPPTDAGRFTSDSPPHILLGVQLCSDCQLIGPIVPDKHGIQRGNYRHAFFLESCPGKPQRSSHWLVCNPLLPAHSSFIGLKLLLDSQLTQPFLDPSPQSKKLKNKG